MMEAKTKPKKKGFNLFDEDDDDDIEEFDAPFISKDPVPEGSKTTTTLTSSNNVMVGSGAAATTLKVGQRAQKQPVHDVSAATTAASIDKTTTTREQKAQQPANTFLSPSNKTDSTGKPITTSKLGSIFGSCLTTTATMTNSSYKNVTTTSTPANQQLKPKTAVKATGNKETTTSTSYDGKVQAFMDSKAGASSSRQPPQTPRNAPTIAAIGVEQQLPSVKATTVTPSVGTQGCPLLSKYQPVPIQPHIRPKLTFRDVLEVSTDDDEEQLLQPVKASTIVQQPKAAVEEAPPVISEFQAVITETVEQNSEASSSVAAVPSDNLDNDLGLALMGLPHKDFAFTVKSDQIPVHKMVLAVRSPHFYQQFYENSGNSSPKFENADDFDKEVIELAVRACYGQYFDETTLDKHIAKQLIIFADVYGMKCVKNLLPQTMAKFITEETICAAAARSYENDDYELRRKCADFIAGLIIQHKPIPLGIEELPLEFNKEIVLAITAKYKKQ